MAALATDDGPTGLSLGGDEMDLHQALSEVAACAAMVEINREWLTLGFLSDGAFTPEEYIERARWQKLLVGDLNALIERQGTESALAAVA